MLAQLSVPARRSVDSYRPPPSGRYESFEQLMCDWPLPGTDRFGCYLIYDSSPYSDIARSMECSVFQEFFGNDAEVMSEEYARYEESSKFLVIADRKRRRPAGVLRIIGNSEQGLKTLNDIQRPPLEIPIRKALRHHRIDDLDRCWDIGTLAVLPEYRSRDHLVSSLLYGLVYREGRRCGIEHGVAILDDHAFRQLTQVFAFPFVPLADSEPFEYLGAVNSRACYLRTADIEPAAEMFLCRLDENTRQLLRPFVGRVLYGEGLPEVVEVVAATGCVPRMR